MSAANGAAIPLPPAHPPHISFLLQPFHLLHMTRDTTVTPSKYCSRSPFSLFLTLNITSVVGTIHSVPFLLPSDIIHTDLG